MHKKKKKEKTMIGNITNNLMFVPNMITLGAMDKLVNWDYRFFRVRKGFLFWYTDDTAREA